MNQIGRLAVVHLRLFLFVRFIRLHTHCVLLRPINEQIGRLVGSEFNT